MAAIGHGHVPAPRSVLLSAPPPSGWRSRRNPTARAIISGSLIRLFLECLIQLEKADQTGTTYMTILFSGGACHSRLSARHDHCERCRRGPVCSQDSLLLHPLPFAILRGLREQNRHRAPGGALRYLEATDGLSLARAAEIRSNRGAGRPGARHGGHGGNPSSRAACRPSAGWGLADEAVRGAPASGFDRAVAHARHRAGRLRAPRAKWVSSEGLHVTLHFFGDCTDAQFEALKIVFADLVPSASCNGSASGLVGRFPARGAPRVLWVGFQRGEEAMRAYGDLFDHALPRWAGSATRAGSRHTSHWRASEPPRYLRAGPRGSACHPRTSLWMSACSSSPC